ncbi:MAG: RusA family crossover junction endodeoxyribonuclease [Candidatus Sabulitectum sp.]|nr:RusA family crossover junction endodeoxyribonuclease [Candidatus Sabulitectum sp.]
MSIQFFIEGAPVAQGRPRFARMGNFTKVYDPKKSKDWKEYVLKVAKSKLGKAPLLEGPLEMTLVFWMPRPKSLPKKVIHHIKKPDVDNLVKGVKDALSGFCYGDDKQIIELHAVKKYALVGEPGGVDVAIREISESESLRRIQEGKGVFY